MRWYLTCDSSLTRVVLGLSSTWPVNVRPMPYSGLCSIRFWLGRCSAWAWLGCAGLVLDSGRLLTRTWLRIYLTRACSRLCSGSDGALGLDSGVTVLDSSLYLTLPCAWYRLEPGRRFARAHAWLGPVLDSPLTRTALGLGRWFYFWDRRFLGT